MDFFEEVALYLSEMDSQVSSLDFSSSSVSIEDNFSDISFLSNDLSPSTMQAFWVLPDEYMEVDDELTILHLLKALGEAMGGQQMELAEEIIRRLKEKASLTGKTLQRLAFYLTLALENQDSYYLMQESSKNYEAAFMAMYQLFPYGRFAHFTANSAILEAMPADARVVHIVDFEIGNGIQWPPLIEALGRRKGLRMLRLISIKWEEDDANFEETKQQLTKHAMDFSLRLEVEEMDMAGLGALVKEIKRGNREWLAFNCMFGLPHMGKTRNLKHVKSFLKTAKALISNSNELSIITLGNGFGYEKWMDYSSFSSFSSFFEGQMAYFQALLESMEQFQFLEARIAMECLFVAPHLSSLANPQVYWEENTGFFAEFDLEEPWRMSKENYVEARELVKEGESSYWVRIEGENSNEIVLGYMGVPLVRVSSWR